MIRMRLRIQGNLIWFTVIAWVLFLIICFHKNSNFGVNHPHPPVRSVPESSSTTIIPTSQSPHTTHSDRRIPRQGKGHSKDNAGEHQKTIKKLKQKANYTKTTLTPLKTLPDDWIEYFSSGKKVIQALWQGNVSSKMLSLRLQRSKRVYVDKNSYNVPYRRWQKRNLTRQELLCQLKQHAQVRTLDGTEEPFASLGWRNLVPSQPLEKLPGTPFRTCAVVSSAGSILKSSLGEEIDSHDAVLRFNAAPTENYDKDVGNKTTIRIINSQILAKAEHKFNTSSLYKNVTLVAWDPTSYSLNIHKWYKKPEHDLFTRYTEHRRNFRSQPFYILHPSFIWSLWNMLQNNTDEKIQPNPPSTGFIGIALMMTLCESVDVYEFIPSIRHTTLCHYYDSIRDMACTLGAYHPLLYEKLLIRRMSEIDLHNRKLLMQGKVTLPGFSKITCPS